MSKKTYSHQNIHAAAIPYLCTCPRTKKTHSSSADGWQTLTVVHSHTHTARPKKIGLSHKQAIEVLMIVILFFTWEDGEREPERQTHTESQITQSAERTCCLTPSEEFKGFLVCV